jgi:hypothetical protein
MAAPTASVLFAAGKQGQWQGSERASTYTMDAMVAGSMVRFLSEGTSTASIANTANGEKEGSKRREGKNKARGDADRSRTFGHLGHTGCQCQCQGAAWGSLAVLSLALA